MAIPKFLDDLFIISKLKDNPRSDGLSTTAFREKFDEGPILIQKFLNEILIPELNNIVDVEALLKNILDRTLTSSDKAAPADVVGKKLIETVRNAGSVTGALFDSTVQAGDFVVAADQNFHAVPITVNKIRVFGGALVAQGNYLPFCIGTYTDVDVLSGTVGTYRNDLICARYSRNADGAEVKSIVLIAGQRKTTQNVVDPEYNSGNINASGQVVRDIPLYRVMLNGVTLTMEPMFAVQTPLREYVDSKHYIRTAVLTADGWAGESAPYTQTVNLEGLSTKGSVHICPVYPNDQDGDIALKDACAAITHAKRGVNSLTFTCREYKPEVDIPIEVEVHL